MNKNIYILHSVFYILSFLLFECRESKTFFRFLENI